MVASPDARSTEDLSSERQGRREVCGTPSELPSGLWIGDCLEILGQLRARYAGQIRCVYLDPPYNSGAARAHYADDLDPEAWRRQMRACLEALGPLLHEDAVIWAHIDDAESAYLKVMMDEIFKRDRHLVTLYVQVRSPGKTLTVDRPFHNLIEHVHGYGAGILRPTRPYDWSRFVWSVALTGAPETCTLGGRVVEIFRRGQYQLSRGAPGPEGLKEIWASGSVLDKSSSGRFFRDHLSGRAAVDGLGALYRVAGLGADGRPWRIFTGPRRAGARRGRYFQGVPQAIRAALAEGGAPAQAAPLPNLLDFAADFGNCAHEGAAPFRGGKKPERLLSWLLEISTTPGDWVLDPFGGSGTTAAVAHKMGRRWLTIERGPQARTHILPRLRRVVAGEDPTGVTAAVGWGGGGGFEVITPRA